MLVLERVRTPRAPASNGETDGQRMRGCAIERHHSCPPLNMHGRRRATNMRDEFNLALLVQCSGCAQPALGAGRPWRRLAERIGAEAVGRAGALEEIQLDEG